MLFASASPTSYSLQPWLPGVFLQAIKGACDPKYEGDLDCLKKAFEIDVVQSRRLDAASRVLVLAHCIVRIMVFSGFVGEVGTCKSSCCV